MSLKKRQFPSGDYTPNGYLDNPYHTYKLNPSGVIRSRPAMGFGWFFPHTGKSYGHRFVYSSHLNIAIEIEGTVFADFPDFAREGVELVSKYHSKNAVSFDFEYSGVSVSVWFLQTSENSIAAVAEINNGSSSNKDIRVYAINTYARNKDASGLWEEGLTGSYNADHDALCLKAYSEGTVMMTRGGGKASGYNLFGSFRDACEYLRTTKSKRRPGPEYLTAYGGSGGTNSLTGLIEYEMPVPRRGKASMAFALVRSETENAIGKELDSAIESAAASLKRRISEDDKFWHEGVSLGGDFPGHWQHGLVYDTETLRMNIRKPLGIFSHVWDAMQIQAPRTVLAEAAFDSLLISYSDPDLAKELMLGTFADSPEVWAPCVREDGSYNMVAWNGFPCGTAPEWGAPVWIVYVIYQRTKDKRWLRKIYPHMVSYINWWLANRVDEEGYVHYLCSYESGQDMSGRFGHQLGGGYDVTHIRPSDLAAAMCDSLYGLEFFAEELGKDSAAAKWRRLGEEYEKKMQSLWCKDGWFHDYDCKAGEFTQGYDAMHLGPFFYSLASETQCEAVRAKIRAMCLGERPTWSTFTLMLAESAFNTGTRKELSQLAYRLVDYIYSSIDAREQKPAMPLPGVEHEFWPMSRNWGAEGYGWGCFSIFMVIRTMFGFRESDEDEDSFLLCPSLAKALLVHGRKYAITNLKYRKLVFNLTYTVKNQREFAVDLEFKKGFQGRKVKIVDYNTSQVHFDGALNGRTATFNADNFSDYLVTIG